MAASYATTLRNAQLDQITSAVGSAGKLIIYDGTRPATGGTATNVLATFTLGSPFAPAASNAALAPTLPAAVSATGNGTATWFRITTSAGAFVIDGSIGSEMTLNTTTISSGLQISITSWAINRGNA
jgi:hypothetical protein